MDGNTCGEDGDKREGETAPSLSLIHIFKTADYIIDMGPEGGSGGGTVVATGTPEEICEVEESYTGQYLKGILNR